MLSFHMCYVSSLFSVYVCVSLSVLYIMVMKLYCTVVPVGKPFESMKIRLLKAVEERDHMVRTLILHVYRNLSTCIYSGTSLHVYIQWNLSTCIYSGTSLHVYIQWNLSNLESDCSIYTSTVYSEVGGYPDS